MVDPATAYVMGVIFVATLVRSTFGFGEALVAVPLLAMRLPLPVATTLAVLVSTIMAAIIVMQDWRHVQFRSATRLLLAALPGVPLGVVLLAKGNEHVVKALLGALIASFSLYSLLGRLKLHLREDHPGWLLGCGFVSGVLGGAYGMNGPPLAVYGALRRWSPQHFRATLQAYFLFASLVGLLGYTAIGLWSRTVVRLFFFSMPSVLLGVLLGRVLNRRMKSQGFFRIVYVGLTGVGILLLVQSYAR